MMRVFGWMLLVVSLCGGCATAGKVVDVAKCATAMPTDYDSVLAAAQSSDEQAVAVAAISALNIALCVKQAVVDKEVATLTVQPDSGTVAKTAAQYSPALDNLIAWRKANP